MSYLSYNPYRPNFPGVDHFVLVYKIEGDKVYVNDPAGYANAYINKKDLLSAWKAKAITYRRDYYRYWANPKRTTIPSKQEVYKKAISFFKEVYSESTEVARKLHVKIDTEVVDEIINKIEQSKLTQAQIEFMTGFSLPLGAKRAYHYSQFFDSHNKELANLKREQERLFGESHSSLMFKNWNGLSKSLKELANVERAFKDLLLRS